MPSKKKSTKPPDPDKRRRDKKMVQVWRASDRGAVATPIWFGADAKTDAIKKTLAQHGDIKRGDVVLLKNEDGTIHKQLIIE